MILPLKTCLHILCNRATMFNKNNKGDPSLASYNFTASRFSSTSSLPIETFQLWTRSGWRLFSACRCPLCDAGNQLHSASQDYLLLLKIWNICIGSSAAPFIFLLTILIITYLDYTIPKRLFSSRRTLR